MNRMYDVLTKISTAIAKVMFVLLIVGMFFTCIDVASRVLFSHSIPGAYELTQLWLCLLSFGCVAYIQTKKGHVNVVLLVQRFPRPVAMLCLAVTHTISTILCGLIVFSSFRQGLLALSKHDFTGVLHIPLGPFYLYEAFCMALFFLLLVIDTIRCFLAITRKEYADEIMSTWV